MILNAGAGGGAGGLRIIASGVFSGTTGSTLTLPQAASMVLVGQYNTSSSGSVAETAMLLLPGCETSGMETEVEFLEDGVTLKMGFKSGSSEARKPYIAFA